MMLYSVRMISANMVSVIVKFLLFKEGYLVEMPTLLMFLMFTVVFSNGVVKLYQRVATADIESGTCLPGTNILVKPTKECSWYKHGC